MNTLFSVLLALTWALHNWSGYQPHPTEKVDPLYWTADEGDQVYISKIADWTMWQARRLSDEKSKTADNTPARLVIGPDLVSE